MSDELDEILTQFEHWIKQPQSTLYRHHDFGRTMLAINTYILAEVLKAKPERLPKVIKRKGFYPPYQPQVEQHRRAGYNQALDDYKANLVTKFEKENS